MTTRRQSRETQIGAVPLPPPPHRNLENADNASGVLTCRVPVEVAARLLVESVGASENWGLSDVGALATPDPLGVARTRYFTKTRQEAGFVLVGP